VTVKGYCKVRLKDKIAIVTGGSRGIGRAISLAFAKEGADVVIIYLEKEKEAKKVIKEITAVGRKCMAFNVDVRDFEEVNEIVEVVVETFGQIDILVNNAGITRDITLKKMSKEMWNEVIDVNLNGVFNCTKAVTDLMRKRKTGRIINISSIMGFTGNIGQTNYAAAKSGILGFTKALAREVARVGITVNAIAPGFINTDMMKTIPENIKRQLLEQIPMGRFGEPHEVANVAVFLALEDSSFITGTVVHINGGLYM
jgi:3-oxoacyl-[acyl-carrier protein] reductase